MNSQGPSYVLAAWCWVVLFPDPVDGLQLNIKAKPLLIRGCLLHLFHTYDRSFSAVIINCHILVNVRPRQSLQNLQNGMA